MGKKILFGVLGVVAGMAVGMAVNMGLVILNQGLHPAPEGVDLNDPEQFKAYAAGLPALAFLVTLLAHQGQAFVGSLVGSLVAGRRSVVVGLIIGVLTLLGCVVMLFIARGPMWFSVLDVVLPLPLALLAAKLVMKRDEAAAD